MRNQLKYGSTTGELRPGKNPGRQAFPSLPRHGSVVPPSLVSSGGGGLAKTTRVGLALRTPKKTTGKPTVSISTNISRELVQNPRDAPGTRSASQDKGIPKRDRGRIAYMAAQRAPRHERLKRKQFCLIQNL